MADAPKKGPPSPGTILALLACAGFGLYLFLLFVGMGVETFGLAKRHYPEVVLGLIAIGLIIAAMIWNRKE